jgi:hypothetical protein
VSNEHTCPSIISDAFVQHEKKKDQVSLSFGFHTSLKIKILSLKILLFKVSAEAKKSCEEERAKGPVESTKAEKRWQSHVGGTLD